MKIFAFLIPVIICFPVPNIPNVDVDIAVQLSNCIKQTTDHFIERVVAAGGLPSDRLYYSRTQIRQLCIAMQTTQQTSTSTTEIIVTTVSSTSPPAESTKGIDSVINLLEELEYFRLMLSP